MTKFVTLTVFVSLFCLGTAQAATSWTLVDDNSTVFIDIAPSVDDPVGMVDWSVDDMDQLYQQWFWYRIGDSSPEASIDTIGTPSVWHADSGDADPGKDILDLTFTETDDFSVYVSFKLNGGTSLSSDIVESIEIKDLRASGDPRVFHFFQYVDFDLGSDTYDDTVEVLNPWVVQQTDSEAYVSETVTVPAATLHEVGIYDATLDSLEDGSPTMLDDSAGPLGLDDVTWAFQWDFTLASGDSFIISKDKYLVIPEPATVGLLVVASLLGLRRRRFRGLK